MKKVKENFSKTVRRRIDLYRDDLEGIDTIFASAYDTHSITVDGYELSGIEELDVLADRKDTIRSVSFEGPRLFGSSPDTDPQEHLAQTESYARVKLDRDSVWLYAANGEDLRARGVLGQVEQILENANPRRLGIGARLRLDSSECHITLQYRGDRPGFWKRNKDKVIVGIILTCVGAVLGALARSLF